MKKKRHIAEQFTLLCEKCGKPVKAKDTVEGYCMDCCGGVLDRYFEQKERLKQERNELNNLPAGERINHLAEIDTLTQEIEASEFEKRKTECPKSPDGKHHTYNVLDVSCIWCHAFIGGK